MRALASSGVTISSLSPTQISLYSLMSGLQKTKTWVEPSAAARQRWIVDQGIPVLDINPDSLDTTKYSGMYEYWTSVPLSNGFGYPLVVGDVDRNGKPEVYGVYRDSITDFLTRVYEVDRVGNVVFKQELRPRVGPAQAITDVDRDGLFETQYFYSDTSFFYEQTAPDSIPYKRSITFRKYESCGAIATMEPVGFMDQDSLTDFVFRGSDPDTQCHNYNTYVAEFDSSIQNFKKVWKKQLWPPRNEAGIGGYDIGDYDSDGKMNILATGMEGQIWVMENDTDNSYVESWTDTIPFVNLLYQTSGDVDGDGKDEFFVSATMSDGNWTIVYEATGDNAYAPTFIFHLRSGGSLDEPTLMTTDADGDGKLDLVILSGDYLYIFRSSGDNSYSLWYLKEFPVKQSVAFYDFDSDGKKDFILSWSNITGGGALVFGAEIYRGNLITAVEPSPKESMPRKMDLSQNYPNPFNSQTTINFILPSKSHVTVSIYNILGVEIARLVDRTLESGKNVATWDATEMPSGVYICRINSGHESASIKLLHLK